MEQFKRARVVMLPTNDKTNIGKEKIGNELRFNSPRHNLYHKHLYIISDDEIKEGNWYIYLKYNTIIQKKDALPLKDNCKKIIATTDTSLKLHDNSGNNHCFGTQLSGNCKHLLPQPSQQFIEKYIDSYNRDKVITDVLVEYEQDLNTITKVDYGLQHWNYKLKINPKDNTITIKKLKDSWNREEVIELFKNLESHIENNMDSDDDGNTFNNINLTQWIEENL